MNPITRRFPCASSRSFLICGTLTLLIGLLGRMGTMIYAGKLLRSLEAEMKQMNGLSFSAGDAMFNLEASIGASYLIMAIGSAMIFIGIVRIRKVPAQTLS